MEKPRSKSLHLQGGAQEDHHLAISGCRNGHGPDLNGEPYALKGARTVRGGSAFALLTPFWTSEGWLYVSAVIDLFSRRVVGWSMSASMTAQLVADALLMAVWRRGKAALL